MIRGNKELKIKEYLFIDRCAEGVEFTKPQEGEELIGLPFGWCDDNSPPFIEHRKGSRVTRSVNCADVSIIVFEG